MMGKKTLSEIKVEVAAMLAGLPGRSPGAWLGKKARLAKKSGDREAETLEMLCAALEQEAGKVRNKSRIRHQAKLK